MTETLGEMIERFHNLREAQKEIRDEAGRLELAILQLMDANDQVAYEDTRFKARIPTKREYDPVAFKKVMGEIMEPAMFNEVYSEAHEVTKTVPASVNGTKAKKLWDQGFAKPLEQTLLPAKRSLKIEVKRDEVGL